MAPLRRAGAEESEAGSPVMNHFLNTGAEGINHREEGFEKSRVLYQRAHPSFCTRITTLETDNCSGDLPGQ